MSDASTTPPSKHPADRPTSAALWTPPQRRALAVILLGLLIVFGVRYALNPRFVSNPQPETPPRAHELAHRIDPNTADWPALAALPSIGEKRAKDIVAYRTRFQERTPGGKAFEKPFDLMKIDGIGPALAESIEPYLVFPTPQTAPSTQP